MNANFPSSRWSSQNLLRWSRLCFSITALLVWQSPLGAQSPAAPPQEPDDFIIVSDEGDVAPADEPEEAGAAEAPQVPRKLPTANHATEDKAASESDDAADADDNESEGESDSESEGDAAVAGNAAADAVAPIDGPAPDVPAATRAQDDETDVVGDEENIGTVRPAGKARVSAANDSTDPSTASEKAEPQAASRMAAEGASFRSVLPSVTTAEELKAAWGPAREVRETEAGQQHVYLSKPFKQVVVTVIDGKVDTILIRLDKQFEPKALAKQLMLDDVEPATIFNAKGQMLGMAFPERGVLFGFASGVPVRVGQIVLEPINSQPFVTRAEKNVRRNPADALADADYAIEIDPEYDRAHAIRARVLIQLGAFDEALAAVDKALTLMPEDADHQLTRANILYQLQRYDEASKLTDALATDAQAPPLVRAQAEKLRGDLLSRGPERKFDVAIKHHTEAISQAEKVSTSNAGPVRRAAKELLVEAHVAVAYDIAWGNWQQKAKVVPRWIERATSFCDNLIAQDFGEECVRLQLFEQSLHAYAGMKDAPDVTTTVDAMQKLARELSAAATDPRQSEVMQWQLGEALSSAMAICQQHGRSDAATQLGQLALACIEKAGKFAGITHKADFLIGKIYYRMGAIEAVDREEHAKAVAWYDKAIPLLERPMPPGALPECGRTGEMFVSMAVTYWEAEKRDEAIRLTQQGANLMKSAVERYGFPNEALSVPYGNLASMHAGVGNNAESKRFAEMASHAEKLRR
jgi:tetratricopeptide (TPR) repeat protein